MTTFDEQGRPEPPLQGGELETLLGFLEFHRATLEWKCSGLDADGLRASLPPSTMTLGGLLKHLAGVEDYWFSERLLGHEPSPPWSSVDWDADIDWDWHSAAQDSPDELLKLWRTAVEHSRACVQDALADGGLDRPTVDGEQSGRSTTLRWILVHMIEEYARHNGHADLIRESIDGRVGE